MSAKASASAWCASPGRKHHDNPRNAGRLLVQCSAGSTSPGTAARPTARLPRRQPAQHQPGRRQHHRRFSRGVPPPGGQAHAGSHTRRLPRPAQLPLVPLDLVPLGLSRRLPFARLCRRRHRLPRDLSFALLNNTLHFFLNPMTSLHRPKLGKSLRFSISAALFLYLGAAAANDAKDFFLGGPYCAWFSLARPVCQPPSIRNSNNSVLLNIHAPVKPLSLASVLNSSALRP